MIRSVHRWAGLGAALLVSATALTGAVLALYPAAEALSVAPTPDLDLGTLAARVQEAVPGLEQMRRAASGQITAFAYDGGEASQWIVDPATGAALAEVAPAPVERWITNLHRALLAGDAGRWVVAAISLAMAALTLSGFALAARRMGGWRRLFGPLRGPLPQRLHMELARLAGAGLLVSSVTGLWLAGLTFGLIPEGSPAPAFPSVSGTGGLAPDALPALGQIAVADLRELTFPRSGNLSDVFTVETDAGLGYIDQGTGEMLAWADRTPLDRVSDVVHMLHTGQGAAIFGLILALSALSVPVLSFTGWMQQSGRSLRPVRRAPGVPAGAADTIVLVGSEGGTTWGFARSLGTALTRAGSSVHLAAMSDFAPESYGRARRILILAATSGDGDAPGSAHGFLDRLAALSRPPSAPFAILGFGDSAFPQFCGYAERVAEAARACGWRELLPAAKVDRQSEQDFARWGGDLAESLGIALDLQHRPEVQASVGLELLSRRDYGAEVQAPTAILRFALPRRSLWQRLSGKGFGRFQAGDLIGILPAGDPVPRYYSLASGTRDGFAEICVRKHPGGLCSGQLMDLQPGQSVRAFLRRNPGFHAVPDEAPLILIGAGTGIGPLAGFARANRARRPMHLYFGARAAASDLLYDTELALWQREGRLASVVTAFSRDGQRRYVQDALLSDAARLRGLIADGARIMVCGGRGMAEGVAAALDDILTPAGLCPVTLKAEGRYVEDVY